jgi:hypothetical protein
MRLRRILALLIFSSLVRAQSAPSVPNPTPRQLEQAREIQEILALMAA